MTDLPNQGPAVVVDFDNTITSVDVGDLVADRFGDRRWRELDRAHGRGEVPLRELLRFMFESMRVTEPELLAYARQVGRLRPGFERFLDEAADRGWHLVLASGGLEPYIRAILGDRAARFEIHANQARFQGDRLQVDFPDARPPGCGGCGNCKAAVVDALRRRGFGPVVAVGDGTSDRCMARVADQVVARDALLAFCRASGLTATPFDDFHDVQRVLAAWL